MNYFFIYFLFSVFKLLISTKSFNVSETFGDNHLTLLHISAGLTDGTKCCQVFFVSSYIIHHFNFLSLWMLACIYLPKLVVSNKIILSPINILEISLLFNLDKLFLVMLHCTATEIIPLYFLDFARI